MGIKKDHFQCCYWSAAERKAMEHTVDPDFVPVGMPEPTTAFPGSPEKVKVLQRRAERGEPLWVPGDVFIDYSDFTEPGRLPSPFGRPRDRYVLDRREVV